LFSKQRELLDHMKTHGDYKCDQCQDRFVTRRGLGTHKRTHNKRAETK
jgi:C2H2-type zinc finger